MYIFLREIAVLVKPPTLEELRANEDEGDCLFDSNLCPGSGKWLNGVQFALSEDDCPEREDLEFRQLLYTGTAWPFEQAQTKTAAAGLIVDNLLVPEPETLMEEEGVNTPLVKRILTDCGFLEDTRLWAWNFEEYLKQQSEEKQRALRAALEEMPRGTAGGPRIAFCALTTFGSSEDAFTSEYYEAYEGRIEERRDRTGEVRIDGEEAEHFAMGTFHGVIVGYRFAPIDEKYIEIVEVEGWDGNMSEVKRVNLQAYMSDGVLYEVLTSEQLHRTMGVCRLRRCRGCRR